METTDGQTCFTHGQIIWHLPPTMPCFNPKGVTTSPFKCRGLARLRSSCTRERERKRVCQIFVLCSTLFIYVIYLSIYQDIKDLLNPAKTNLKIHENAQVGWRNPWKKKKINNNKLKWIKMKKVLLCTVSSTCTLMTVLHLGNK